MSESPEIEADAPLEEADAPNPPTVVAPAPCACGHHHRVGTKCADCRCRRYCPDYVAQARAAKQPVTEAMVAYQKTVQQAVGWRKPSSLRKRRCDYCNGSYRPIRADSKTCSGACRIAMCRALRYTSDVDVPSPAEAERRETYSAERRAATGVGNMTRRESFEADLRVRRRARRRKRRK